MSGRALVGLWLAVALTIIPVQGAPPEKPAADKNARIGRWALLVGVDDYAEAAKLQYCGADMRAMSEQLVASGFPEKQVFLLHDKAEDNKYRPMKANIERQLDLVLNLVEPGDLIVVGFSGHGVHIEGKSYLCPAETRLDEPATMVPLDAVYERLKQCPAALKLLLVDACRNDPRQGGQRSLKPTEGAKQFARSLEQLPEGILLLSSCAPGQISMEDEEFAHGVFMHYVLDGLRGQADDDANGAVSLVELYKFANRETKTHVARKFNGYQTPSLRGDIADDFDVTAALINTKAAALLEQGRAFHDDGQNVEAIKAYTEALRLDPRNHEAWNWLGMVRDNNQEPDKAIEAYSQAVRLKPDFAPAYHNRALVYDQKREYDKALADYKEALRINPQYAVAYRHRGDTYDNLGDLQKSLADYEEAIRLNPEDSMAFHNRGYLYNKLSEYEKAAADFVKAVELKPDFALAWRHLGDAHDSLGQSKEAVADFTKAVELDPEDDVTLHNRGYAYERLGEFDKAIEDYTASLRLDPKDKLTHVVRGDLYRQRRRFDEAIADYGEAIRLEPKYARAYNARGLCYSSKGDVDTAIADFNEAIQISPDDAVYYYNRGCEYRKKKEYDQALADFTKAIRLNPKDADSFNRRGLIYDDKEMTDQAIADYSEAIRLNPNHQAAYYNRALSYRAKGQKELSEADEQKVRQLQIERRYRPGEFVRIWTKTASVQDRSETVAEVHRGDRFEVKEDNGEWVLVELSSGGKTGWVHKTDLE